MHPSPNTIGLLGQVLVGVLVGGTPLSQFCLPVVAESAVGVEATTGAVMMLHSVAAGVLRPIFDVCLSVTHHVKLD